MPVFSFTAPHITPEEEKRERESLTDDLRKELERDIYGDVEGDVDNEEKDDNDNSHNNNISSLLLLEEMDAIIEKTPKSRKKDYLDAKERVPDLIESEANPIQFLRCEQSNVAAATTRMLLYWKTRRKLFGDDRAFLPMTLAGALRDDLDIVESGILAVLPNDAKGRGVLFFDRIRAVPPLATREGVLRAVFYMLHVMTESVELQQKGYVCLLNFKGYDLYKHFDRILTKQNSIIMLECMPIKIKAEHLLTGSANGVMSLVLPVRKHVVAKDIRLRMVVHTGTDEKILESFKSYGLSAKNIGHVSGGEYKHDDFLDWLDARRELEEKRGGVEGSGRGEGGEEVAEETTAAEAVVVESAELV